MSTEMVYDICCEEIIPSDTTAFKFVYKYRTEDETKELLEPSAINSNLKITVIVYDGDIKIATWNYDEAEFFLNL
jgi:hypothetical protein